MDKLKDLIEKYLQADSLKHCPLVEPLKPTPLRSYKVVQWNNYHRAMTDWATDHKDWEEKKNEIESVYKKASEDLMNYIPNRLTWFITEDESYAVAIQISDWPGDPPKLIIKTNPVVDELPVLRCQIVN